MAAIVSAEPLAEAELVASSCSPERRVHMVQRLTELFAADAAHHGKQRFHVLSLASARHAIRFEPPAPGLAKVVVEACP